MTPWPGVSLALSVPLLLGSASFVESGQWAA